MSFFFSPSRRAPDASSSSSSSAPGGGDEDGGESSVVSALVSRLAGFQVEKEEALDALRRERDTAQRRLAEAEGVVLAQQRQANELAWSLAEAQARARASESGDFTQIEAQLR